MTKRKRILIIIAAAILLLLLAGIGIAVFTRADSVPVLPASIKMLPQKEQPSERLGPEGEIVLISRSVNYAWGYDNTGVFVDSAGNVYPFDFHAQYGGYSSSLNEMEKFELIRQWVNPSAHMDPAELESFISLSRKIRDRESYRSESKMYDYGEKQLLFCDPDTGEELLLAEWGDVDRSLTDLNASAAILKGRAIADAAYRTKMDACVLRVYMPEDMPFMEFPADGQSGRYVLRYPSQLKLMETETGIPLGQMADSLEDYEQERYVFFVDFAAVGTPTAIFCRDGAFSLLTEGESAPHCIVAAFPKDAYPITSDGCEAFSGDAWKVYQNGDPDCDPEVRKGLSYGVSDDRMHLVWEEFDMHGFKGVCLQSEQDYERFLASCEEHELMEDGSSVRALFEADAAPDFSNYVLCVRIARRDVGMEFGWGTLNLLDGYVLMGLESDPPQNNGQSNPRTDGVIAWVWMPRHYLQPGTSYGVQ